jgi:hypothetical protein
MAEGDRQSCRGRLPVLSETSIGGTTDDQPVLMLIYRTIWLQPICLQPILVWMSIYL